MLTFAVFRRTPGQACGRRCRYSVVALWLWWPQRSVVFGSSLNAAMLAQSAAILSHLFMHLFRTCCENFRPRSLKVRSPGHVKRHHLRKVWMLVIVTLNDWSHLNFQRLIALTANSIYKMFISEFWYRWPKIRSILRPFHYKLMVEI